MGAARCRSNVERIIACMRLVLASASPRRAELLRGGLRRSTVSRGRRRRAPCAGRSAPPTTCGGWPLEKARAAARCRPGSTRSCSAPTRRWSIDGEILGKPADDEDARRMLRRLSGRAHEVLTGVASATRQAQRCRRSRRTVVRFAAQCGRDSMVCRHGEARDKAGAYAIQGLASRFIAASRGRTRTSSACRSRWCTGSCGTSSAPAWW